MSQENARVARSFWEAYNRRDREGVRALLHPEVEWHTVAGPLFGVEAIHGREDLLRFGFEQIPEALEGFRVTIEEASELPDGQVLVVGHQRGRGVESGAAVEMHTAGIVRLDGGMIVSFQEFATREEALEAAGLEE
jgi:ketosteroid isomerase-like protein